VNSSLNSVFLQWILVFLNLFYLVQTHYSTVVVKKNCSSKTIHELIHREAPLKSRMGYLY
jgi:hypothetical protein